MFINAYEPTEDKIKLVLSKLKATVLNWKPIIPACMLVTLKYTGV